MTIRVKIFPELKHVDFYSMSFPFDLKKKLGLYVPRLIFGSPFLSEVTSISFTGECSYRRKWHFAGSEPDFARPVKI